MGSEIGTKHAGKNAREESAQSSRRRLPPLALTALGVVFGDIGTSPLYAYKQCFGEGHGFAPTHEHVLGILSLILWALIGVVCIKYAAFVLRADYEGEGGNLALLALLRPTSRAGIPTALPAIGLLVLFGAGMLYGDGVITPAISVLSALEGVDVATTALHNLIVPLTVVILLGLFMLQRRGTGAVGAIFGPIMTLWFFAIAISGIGGILTHPAILAAINPLHGLRFLLENGWAGVLVLGAVVLCVSGVEALYADLGHFGRQPIQLAWFVLVFPALVLNYFGQGALTLANPKALENPFYLLFPSWALYPMVLLATVATIIASQALISGAFSLTQQAVQLGYSPRFEVIHTSRKHAGQIYMPTLNAMLAVACVAIVLAFRSSDRLGAAYGLAVTVTMLSTSITYGVLARSKWRWPWWQVIVVVGFFLGFEVSFLIGNLPKLAAGGWIPAVIAFAVFILFTTWVEGRRRFGAALAELSTPLDEFLRELGDEPPNRAEGTAIFLTPLTDGIPFALRHQWLRHEILHEQIVLLSVVNERRPYVPVAQRVHIEILAPSLARVTAHYGFMQNPRVNQIVALCKQYSDPAAFADPSYFLARPRLVPDHRPGAMSPWRRTLYAIMLRNATPLTDSLGLPPDRVVEFGVAIPL